MFRKFGDFKILHPLHLKKFTPEQNGTKTECWEALHFRLTKK